MGLLNSALQIGRSAILSYQGALQAIGNNISNVGSPDHTRRSIDLDPIQGAMIAGGLQPGAGVALTNIQRNIDESLESRIRLAIGDQQLANTRQLSYAQLESLLVDINGTGVSSRLVDFFLGFDELQNNPEDSATRDLTVTSGVLLAGSLHDLRAQIAALGEDIDGQIQNIVLQADEIANQIARLNSDITTSETGRRGQANALRDQRDGLLRELGEIFDVTVREQPDGALNVYVGNEALVQGDVTRGLVAVLQSDGEFTRTSIRFADTNQEISVQGGRLAGLLSSREDAAFGRISAIDELAAAVINDVNRIHSNGQGRDSLRNVTGTYDVLATDVSLNSSAAGLPFSPTSGSFYITVIDDASGTPVSQRINVLLDGSADSTTLESLVLAINTQTSNINASITSDNRLAISADDGFSFVFGYDGQQPRADTSGVLAALGVNTFFTGTDARNISVNETLINQPSLLAAASVFVSGDGSNAGNIASLDTSISQRLNNVSLVQFFNAISNSVATGASGANSEVDATDSVLISLQTQKESISGVSLDEEAIALVKFQRAFQGAARYISVVDQLIGELISIIR